MGNGASVKKVGIKNETEVGTVKEAFLNRSLSFGEIETPRYSTKKIKEEVTNAVVGGLPPSSSAGPPSTDAQLGSLEMKKLRNQVGWLETVKLDLDDRVENLTAQVDHLKHQNCSLSNENLQLQINVKKLEAELEQSNGELASSQNQYEELKNEAKRKIKASQRKLAELKQSTSLQIFELKQENEDLKSAAAATITQSSRLSTYPRRSDDIPPDQTNGDGLEIEDSTPGGCVSESSCNLIVTLSNKIEEQQLEIDRLKKQVAPNLVDDNGDG